MRQIEFKMEREGLVNVGDVLDVVESKLPNSYYYTLGRSFAMSGNYKITERLSTENGKTKGKVVDIKNSPKGYYIVVEFEE